MKSTHYLSLAGLLLLLTYAPNLRAQAFMNTDASIVKVLSDSTYLTAMEVTFPPGYKTNTHTHSAQWVYALTDGTLKVMYTDGQTEEFSMKAGENFYAGPERPHMTQNITDQPIRFLLVELKEHAYKEMKMKK